MDAIRDHPRACGEQAHEFSDAEIRAGSSPRVRGAATHRADDSYSLGIIPACAGSSFTCMHGRFLGRDHPHLCGEQGKTVCLTKEWMGSSPRVRRAAVGTHVLRAPSGIIPACAGSSA